jgi:hypothetical protein
MKMSKHPVTIADIASSDSAREEFQEAWRIDKGGIRRVALEVLESDGLLVITDYGDGEAGLHFTNTDDLGIKMVIGLIMEDAEPVYRQ